MPSRSEDESKVSSWGFSHVFTWRDGPNAYYRPHSHSGLTTHLIRKGSLSITYPEDTDPTKETFGVGARVDVPAGKVHEVWMGDDGEYLRSAAKRSADGDYEVVSMSLESREPGS
ncbi:uncharacterized protein HMPREF1541_08204 [Cyphellophora europaea CBS 101466]|uniref:Cupin 2 conserved barrel domain-containing protein n=1 Tax=Cyphellophora europaea (strain CBS 101466) TaxID=1220924 RepID=W2RN97_CYPE1|nr:uncharacterized protein HMPREF1541_08204 [Cyphellophora europaea CBS 101466]ETN37214.1 hypothetical protein HMPREF1541_08204 [Cyphellophora europaea CBS 101466]